MVLVILNILYHQDFYPCSANLPISDDIDPAQTDDDPGGKQMNVLTYTGNGSTRSLQECTDFQPDLVFLKNVIIHSSTSIMILQEVLLNNYYLKRW